MEIKTYWNNYLLMNHLPLETKYADSFFFGNSKKMANDLLNLVLQGKKSATTSAYVEENLENPQIGDYSIITDFYSNPECIVKTTKVTKLKFKDMTYDMCRLEGENPDLKGWQDEHIKFFKSLKEDNSFDWNMQIIFEQFELVYK